MDPVRPTKEPEDGRDRAPALELDLRGLKCPLPVLRARKALRALAPGQRLALLCTDPMSAIDIPHFAREDGHRLEAQSRADGVLRFTIRRGDDPAPQRDPRVD